MSFLRYHLPLIVYAGIIFYLSSIPNLAAKFPEFNLSDKIAHFVEFLILGILIWRSACRWNLKVRRRWLIALAITIGVTYAAGDEIHQSFVPGRYAHVLDWTADSFGLIMGISIGNIFLKNNGKVKNDV